MVVAESLTSSYRQNECGRKLWMAKEGGPDRVPKQVTNDWKWTGSTRVGTQALED